MKDNFSYQSANYAKYRPSYPDALFKYIYSIASVKEKAWDCGTGNGQVAEKLSAVFEHVFASDISSSQIENGVKKSNIHYSVQAAEQSFFPDDYFDLITVAQAIHWFDFEKFYREVKRVSKNNGLIVITGYGLCKIDLAMDSFIKNFYNNIIGNYWDKERKYIDEDYRTIPFPFEEVEAPAFHNVYEWTLEHFIGYLNTWSAVKHYRTKNNANPVELIIEKLKECWGEKEKRIIHFPLLLRIGKISKS